MDADKRQKKMRFNPEGFNPSSLAAHRAHPRAAVVAPSSF
jgi:hypothetical protein